MLILFTQANTAHHKSTFSLSTPAFTETTRHKATLPAIQVTVVEAHEGDEMSGKEDEQSLAVTPESFTLSSMETATTFSSGDTEDEDFLDSATSNDLPSPEIFRRENKGVSECMCTFLYVHSHTWSLTFFCLDSGNLQFFH